MLSNCKVSLNRKLSNFLSCHQFQYVICKKNSKFDNEMYCAYFFHFQFKYHTWFTEFFLKASYRLDLRDRFGAEPHLPRHLEGLKSGFNWAVRTWIVPSWDILRDNPQWLKQSKFELVFWRQVHSSGSEKVTFEFSTTRVLK